MSAPPPPFPKAKLQKEVFSPQTPKGATKKSAPPSPKVNTTTPPMSPSTPHPPYPQVSQSYPSPSYPNPYPQPSSSYPQPYQPVVSHPPTSQTYPQPHLQPSQVYYQPHSQPPPSQPYPYLYPAVVYSPPSKVAEPAPLSGLNEPSNEGVIAREFDPTVSPKEKKKSESDLLVWLKKVNLEFAFETLDKLGAEIDNLKFLTEKDLQNFKPLQQRQILSTIQNHLGGNEKLIPPQKQVDLLSFPKEFLEAKEWETKGFVKTPYRSYLIKDGDSIKNKEQYELLLRLFGTHLHGENIKINRAFAVQSEGVKGSFTHYVNALSNNYREHPAIFKKEDWKQDSSKVKTRQWMLDKVNSILDSFDSNESQVLPVMPVLHGTTEKVAWQICQNGFATVSSLDEGWFGKGMYFTSHAEYAFNNYAKVNEQDERTLLLCILVPGNVFPVVEQPSKPDGFKGKPCMSGYQSHYTIVKKGACTPCDETFTGATYDEIVVFQQAQVYPMYVLFTK